MWHAHSSSVCVLSFVSSSWFFFIFLPWFSFFEVEAELKGSIVQPKSCNFWVQNRYVYQNKDIAWKQSENMHTLNDFFFFLNTKIKQSFMSNVIASRSQKHPYLKYHWFSLDYSYLTTRLFRPGLSLHPCFLHIAEIVSTGHLWHPSTLSFNDRVLNYFHFGAVWKEPCHWLREISFVSLFWMVPKQLS